MPVHGSRSGHSGAHEMGTAPSALAALIRAKPQMADLQIGDDNTVSSRNPAVKLDLGGTLVLMALLGLAGPTLFGVSMLNTRIHGAVGEVQDKVRRRRES